MKHDDPADHLGGRGALFLGSVQALSKTPKDQRKSTRQQKFKLAKVLIGALLALMAITYSMRGLGESLDGKPHEPTLAEQVVTFLSK